jgi:deoxyribodipyrimidine photo-lyase
LWWVRRSSSNSDTPPRGDREDSSLRKQKVLVFHPTRSEALSRLAGFVPHAGRAYTDDRNYDHGPLLRGNVSVLSPYLRHRLITEREVCAAVLAEHSLQASEKFIQEVLWRTYWKGWLELRSGVWRRYQAGLAQQQEVLARNGGLRRDYAAAISGNTGFEGFDDWARELVETGYLHNHARMWFASIWIFTLRLPWELGADFLYRHLLDGDPASNTLSWRWVGGLQTKGKTYAATADNIHKYTGGRFKPKGLAREAVALEEGPVEAASPLAPCQEHFDGEAALLITEEDYGVESLPVNWPRLQSIAVANLTDQRSDLPVSVGVAAFAEGAARDTLARLRTLAPGAAIRPDPILRITAGDILPWLEKAGQNKLLIPAASVGPVATAVDVLTEALAKHGIAVERVRRRWDGNAWPHATRGFFAFKEQLPGLLRAEGIL